MEEKKRCPGCGAVFQSVDEGLPGYLVPGKEPGNGVICKRCFQLKHYGTYRKALISDPEIQRKIQAAAHEASAVFLVMDVTRPEISFPDLDWAEGLRKNIFLIANKADLLEPWSTRKETLRWLSDQTGADAEQILLVSARSKGDMSELRHLIYDSFDESDTLLFAGAANVGKSTILGELIKNAIPTVSRLPGTTVGLTKYKMEGGPSLVDAPGLKGEDPFLPVLCPDCLASLSPRKGFQSVTEVLRPGQTFFFGGIAALTVTDAGERGWVRLSAFAPDTVTVHRTREDRIEGLVHDHSGEILVPPCHKCADRLARLKWHEESFNLRPEEDLAIPGIGWAALYSGVCEVRLRAPDFVKGRVRPWLVTSPARRMQGKKRY